MFLRNYRSSRYEKSLRIIKFKYYVPAVFHPDLFLEGNSPKICFPSKKVCICSTKLGQFRLVFPPANSISLPNPCVVWIRYCYAVLARAISKQCWPFLTVTAQCLVEMTARALYLLHNTRTLPVKIPCIIDY